MVKSGRFCPRAIVCKHALVIIISVAILGGITGHFILLSHLLDRRLKSVSEQLEEVATLLKNLPSMTFLQTNIDTLGTSIETIGKDIESLDGKAAVLSEDVRTRWEDLRTRIDPRDAVTSPYAKLEESGSYHGRNITWFDQDTTEGQGTVPTSTDAPNPETSSPPG